MSKELVSEILMEIISMDPRDTVTVTNAAARLVLAERERCAAIADSEPALEGPMPPENAAIAQKVSLEDHLRATVKVTRENIARRIREGQE